MPYRDSIGQPAGYQNGSPYGALEPEDMYEDDVLNEPVGNPLTDGEMYEAEMGPEMGQIPGAPEMPGQMPMGEMGPEMGQNPEMGQAPEAEMDSQYAGDMMRERIRKREEKLSNASMRFMDVTHELNK